MLVRFLLSHPAYKGDKTKLDRETSQRLIDQNFSNYSAWHLRSTLKDLDVHEELDLVRRRGGICGGVVLPDTDCF